MELNEHQIKLIEELGIPLDAVTSEDAVATVKNGVIAQYFDAHEASTEAKITKIKQSYEEQLASNGKMSQEQERELKTYKRDSLIRNSLKASAPSEDELDMVRQLTAERYDITPDGVIVPQLGYGNLTFMGAKVYSTKGLLNEMRAKMQTDPQEIARRKASETQKYKNLSPESSARVEALQARLEKAKKA